MLENISTNSKKKVRYNLCILSNENIPGPTEAVEMNFGFLFEMLGGYKLEYYIQKNETARCSQLTSVVH